MKGDLEFVETCGSLPSSGSHFYEGCRSRLYNSAHAISPLPHAVVARGLAGRTDFFRVRTRAHRVFARTSSDPPPGRINRRPLTRSTALHRHRFRNSFSDHVHAL